MFPSFQKLKMDRCQLPQMSEYEAKISASFKHTAQPQFGTSSEDACGSPADTAAERQALLYLGCRGGNTPPGSTGAVQE